jgi:hypothetical protein
MDLIHRPRHKWLDEHRQLLCVFSVSLLHIARPQRILTKWEKFYDNSVEEIASIFNHILTEDLKAEGFKMGLRPGTVQLQLKSMQQGSTGYDIWRKVIIDVTLRDARKKFRESRDAIEDSAFSLGIVLHLRAEENSRLKPHDKRPRKRQNRKEDLEGVLGDWVSSNDDSESELDSSLSRKRKSASTETLPETPTRRSQCQLLTPLSKQSGASKRIAHRGQPKPRTFPRLVFRWYNTKSQGLNTPTELRAGKFLDRSQRIPPPAWEREAVTNHLVPHKSPSPFISFRESCRPCIFRALKAGVDTNACITVVDLHKLRELSNQQWGHGEAIKACPELVEHFDLKLGTKGLYTGGGEWLVHGK